MRLFSGPVVVVAIGIALIIAIGVWGKGATPVSKPAEPVKEQPAAGQPKESSPPPVSTAPKTESDQPAQPNTKAILEQRRHLDRAGGAVKTMLTTVYYVDGLTNSASIQPVEMRIPLTDSIVRATAEQVIMAPTDLKLYSSVPAGTKVQSVNLDRNTGVATVDLSAEAGNVQGTEAAQAMRAAFVYSLTAIKDVKAVQLRVNGRPAVLHGIEWSQPLTREKLEERSSYKVEPVVKFVP